MKKITFSVEVDDDSDFVQIAEELENFRCIAVVVEDPDIAGRELKVELIYRLPEVCGIEAKAMLDPEMAYALLARDYWAR